MSNCFIQALPWKTAAIVAIDLMGGFSKDGKIPWNYSEDFKWFQNHTKDNICVMGRTTYDDINSKLGDRAIQSVLPDRECYVVTSSPLPRQNATRLSSISSLTKYHDEDNAHKTVFFIGGERIYEECMPLVDEVYVTILNTVVDGCDKFFPTTYVAEHFKTLHAKQAKTFDALFVCLRRTVY